MHRKCRSPATNPAQTFEPQSARPVDKLISECVWKRVYGTWPDQSSIMMEISLIIVIVGFGFKSVAGAAKSMDVYWCCGHCIYCCEPNWKQLRQFKSIESWYIDVTGCPELEKLPFNLPVQCVLFFSLMPIINMILMAGLLQTSSTLDPNPIIRMLMGCG